MPKPDRRPGVRPKAPSTAVNVISPTPPPVGPQHPCGRVIEVFGARVPVAALLNALALLGALLVLDGAERYVAVLALGTLSRDNAVTWWRLTLR